MTWTTLTAAQRASGQPLDANMIDALYLNPTAIANGDTGAPKIQTAALEQTGGSEAVTTATIRAGAITSTEIATYAVSHELLQAQSPSAASVVDFTTGFSSNYKAYYMVFSLENGTNNWGLQARLYANSVLYTGAAYSGDGAASNTSFTLGSAIGGNAVGGSGNYNAIAGTFEITNPQTTGSIRCVEVSTVYPATSTTSYPALLSNKTYKGAVMSSNVMDYIVSGIRIYPSTGTITGTIHLYGINA